jgi:hypothetical protein
VGDLSRIESAIAELRSVAQQDDLQEITRKLADVQREAQTLADLAARGRTQQSSAASGGSAVQEGEVIDAEPIETHKT